MSNTVVRPLPSRIETKFIPNGDVAGMVRLVAGSAKGTLTISYSQSAILKIVNQMSNQKNTGITYEVCDAVGKMTNQIYKNTNVMLTHLGHQFEPALPIVIHGEFCVLKYQPEATLVIPFEVASTRALFNAEFTLQS